VSAPRPRRLARTLPGDDGKRYRYRQATGAPSPWTSADRVRAHLDRLAGWGMSNQMIADAAGITRTAVSRQRRRSTSLVYRHYEAAILAVDYRPHPDQYRVLTVGSRRRVQALAVLGHSQRSMANRVGVHVSDLGRVLAVPTILATTQRAIFDLYDELWLTPGPSARSRTWALKAGWSSPGEWDEDTIDDPDAEPIPCRRIGSGGGVAAEDVAWLLSPDGGNETPAAVASRFGLSEESVLSAAARWRARATGRQLQKVTDEQVAEIRRRGEAGESGKALAAEFGLAPSTVSYIRRGYRRAPAAPALPDREAG